VRDLTLPPGVEVLENADETICVVAPPRAEVEVAPVAAEGAEASTEPEVIRAKKEEEDAEAAKK
jgi:hypothetical protein